MLTREGSRSPVFPSPSRSTSLGYRSSNTRLSGSVRSRRVPSVRSTTSAAASMLSPRMPWRYRAVGPTYQAARMSPPSPVAKSPSGRLSKGASWPGTVVVLGAGDRVPVTTSGGELGFIDFHNDPVRPRRGKRSGQDPQHMQPTVSSSPPNVETHKAANPIDGVGRRVMRRMGRRPGSVQNVDDDACLCHARLKSAKGLRQGVLDPLGQGGEALSTKLVGQLVRHVAGGGKTLQELVGPLTARP